MTILYANPYDISYTGFYFSTLDEFTEQMAAASFEEVEIDYIDGDNPQLFSDVSINQANLDTWFDHLDTITDDSEAAIAICFLLQYLDLAEAIDRHEDVIIWHGSADDYAADLIEQTTDLSQLTNIIGNYINYQAIARDMQLNGEIVEVTHDTWVVNGWDF